MLVRSIGVLGVLVAVLLPARNVPADDEKDTTPVTVHVIGTGEIRVIVADGAAQPCDASENEVLFDGRVKAGSTLSLTSGTGSVCVDHTYGEMRESEWAGPSIWSGVAWPGAPVSAIRGTVSTDEP